MAKTGEIDYLKNLVREQGDEAVRHAVGKPFSDSNCPGYLAEMGALLTLLPSSPAKLLDMGCGTGWTSFFFAKSGYHVTGVDIAPDMIHCAQQRLEREPQERLQFLTADYEEFDGAGAFDAVVFYDALHHAVDETAALRCAFRALKPGGVCITSEPGSKHHHSKVARDAVRKFDVTEKAMPPAKIVGLSRRVGFRDYRVYPHAFRIQREVFSPYRPRKRALHLVTAPCRMLLRIARLVAWNEVGCWVNGITVLVK